MRVFYDLTCPFCYLAQPFNKQLLKAGVQLTELPFQAHPEVPKEGQYMGPRRGPMYDNIAARAKVANLPLKMRDVLPNSRLANAVAEWARRNRPDVADQIREKLFHAHFAGDQDIGDLAVLVEVAKECGVDGTALEAALEDGSAVKFVDEAGRAAVEFGVSGTPAWESGGHAISGLQETLVWKMAEKEMKEASYVVDRGD